MRLGYARVSTRDQSFDLQVDALKKANCEKIYKEVASGARTARPILDDLLSRATRWLYGSSIGWGVACNIW